MTRHGSDDPTKEKRVRKRREKERGEKGRGEREKEQEQPCELSHNTSSPRSLTLSPLSCHRTRERAETAVSLSPSPPLSPSLSSQAASLSSSSSSRKTPRKRVLHIDPISALKSGTLDDTSMILSLSASVSFSASEVSDSSRGKHTKKGKSKSRDMIVYSTNSERRPSLGFESSPDGHRNVTPPKDPKDSESLSSRIVSIDPAPDSSAKVSFQRRDGSKLDFSELEEKANQKKKRDTLKRCVTFRVYFLNWITEFWIVFICLFRSESTFYTFVTPVTSAKDLSPDIQSTFAETQVTLLALLGYTVFFDVFGSFTMLSPSNLPSLTLSLTLSLLISPTPSISLHTVVHTAGTTSRIQKRPQKKHDQEKKCWRCDVSTHRSKSS